MIYYFFRAIQKIGLLNFINVIVSKKFTKSGLNIPLVGKIGLSNLVTIEPWLIDIVAKFQKIKPGLVIDVGVNIGQTLLKIKQISKDIPYIGFEPNPECIFYLNKLIRHNNFLNTIIYPVGLSEENKILKLFSNNTAASGASLIDGFRKDVKKYLSHAQFVAVFNGDQLLEKIEFKDISVIKIDVEGGEKEVIAGLSNSIINNQPFIICEILPIYSLTEASGFLRKKRQDELIALLNSFKYLIFRINRNGTYTYLTEIEVHSDMELVDYIFVPQCYLNLFKENFETDNVI